jgi:hypothetical protein
VISNFKGIQDKIVISGDLQDKINFAVGTEVASFREFQAIDITMLSYPPLAIAAALYLLLVLLGIIYLPLNIKAEFERAYAYMNGDTEIEVILGNALPPLFVGFLLRRLPKFARLSIVVLVLYPFILPYGITTIETELSFEFIWGYFCSGHLQFDTLCAYLGYYYFARIACEFMALFGLFAFNGRIGRFVDGFFSVLFICSAVCTWQRSGRDSSQTSSILRVSPAFHLIPLAMAVAITVLFFQSRRIRRNEWPRPSFVPWTSTPSESII